MTGKITIKEVEFHRNGICGNGFNVILFNEKDGGKVSHKMAVVFEESGSCAVFDTDMLAQGNIKFTQNSWRGDLYEAEMREAIKKWLDALTAKYERD